MSRTGSGDSRFLSNTAALAIAAVASTLFTLIQVKILAGHLTREMFGLFAALRGLSLLASMLAANGLPQILVRYLPVHEARGDRGRAVALSVTCAAIATALTALFVAAMHVLRGPVFSSVPDNAMSPGFLFWFYVTTLGVTLKLVLYGGLGGLRRLGAQTWLETSSLAVQVAWVFALRGNLGLENLFMILGVVSIAGVAAGIPWYARRLAGDIRPGSSDGAAVSYRDYWPGAVGLSLVAVAFSDVDRYVLSGVLALEMLSLFHIASRVVRLSHRFLGIPVLAFQPEVSRIDAQGRRADVELSTRVYLKFNIVASVFVAAAVAVFSAEIIRVIATEAYLGARPLLLVMAASIPLTAMTSPLTSVMKALEQIREAFLCDLLWALSYLALLVTLGRSFGLMGAGYALLVACLLQLVLAVRLGRMHLATPLLRALWRSAACALVFVLPLAVSGIAAPEWAKTIARAILFLAAAFAYRRAVASAGVMDPGERRRLDEMLARGGVGRVVGRLFA